MFPGLVSLITCFPILLQPFHQGSTFFCTFLVRDKSLPVFYFPKADIYARRSSFPQIKKISHSDTNDKIAVM